MKQVVGLVVTVMITAIIFLPVSSAFAQAKKVPITYPGDTEKAIASRAEWVEGARKEGQLVWWGTLSPSLANRFIAEFNKIYPFIKVEFWSGRASEIQSKLEAQQMAGRMDVDVCLGGTEPQNFPRWRKMGLLAKFTDIIPGIEKMDKGMYSVHGDLAMPGNNAITPQYNTKLVSAAEAPKSWEDLLDPRWKGQIGVPVSSLKQWAGLALAEGGWGIEKTEAFLKKLKGQEPRFGQGYTAVHTLLIAGEFKVSAGGYIYHVFQSQKKAAPVEWSRVSPVLITGSLFNMVQNAPHPNAARLFLQWALSSQGLVVWDKITLKGAAFPGAGTPTSQALKGLKLLYRTEETELKIAEAGLVDKFAQILGVTPAEGD